MGTPFLSELRITAFNFAPKGWAMCNGQLLPINQNQALFSLLGTTYGGNGVSTFALPNLQSRVPLHLGATFVQGQLGGEGNHTLVASEMPAHNHVVSVAQATGTVASPSGNYWAGVKGAGAYSNASPTALMAPGTIGTTGGSAAHNNMPPYLVLNIVIALQGIFPSRS